MEEIREIWITAGGKKERVYLTDLWDYLDELPQDESVSLEMDTNKTTVNKDFSDPSELSDYMESYLEHL